MELVAVMVAVGNDGDDRETIAAKFTNPSAATKSPSQIYDIFQRTAGDSQF